MNTFLSSLERIPTPVSSREKSIISCYTRTEYFFTWGPSSSLKSRVKPSQEVQSLEGPWDTLNGSEPVTSWLQATPQAAWDRLKSHPSRQADPIRSNWFGFFPTDWLHHNLEVQIFPDMTSDLFHGRGYYGRPECTHRNGFIKPFRILLGDFVMHVGLDLCQDENWGCGPRWFIVVTAMRAGISGINVWTRKNPFLNGSNRHIDSFISQQVNLLQTYCWKHPSIKIPRTEIIQLKFEEHFEG